MVNNIIEVTHPNGYKGVIYGISSMAIFKGKELILHTCRRDDNCNSAEELYKQLDGMPKLMSLITTSTIGGK